MIKRKTQNVLSPREILDLAKGIRTVEPAPRGYIGAVDTSQDPMFVVSATYSMYNPSLNDRSRNKMVYWIECRAVPQKYEHEPVFHMDNNLHTKASWEAKNLGRYPHFDSLDNSIDSEETEDICKAVYLDLETKYVAAINEEERKKLRERNQRKARGLSEVLGLARKLITGV